MRFIFQHKIIAGIAVIILAGGGYYFYSASTSNKNETRYFLSAAEKGTLIVSVSGSGNIETADSSDASSDISGEIESVNAALGDKVGKGQIIAVIKNDELDIKEESAKSSLNLAKESVSKAKLGRAQKYQEYYDLKQKQKSNPENVSNLDIKISAQKVRDADFAIKSAEIKVKEANLALDQAKENAAARIIKAPISGTITALNIKIGDDLGTTSSSSTRGSLMTITDLDKLFAKISLNEIDVAKIKADQKATLTFDAVENLTLTGKVAEIESVGAITQGVVSYAVKIALDSTDSRIKPGMSTSAAIVTDVKTDAVMVPNGAVKSSNGSFYVEAPDETAPESSTSESANGIILNNPPRKITVEIGLSNDTSTEIISGIKVGDQVISRTSTNSTGQAASQAPSLFGGSSRIMR